MVANLLGKRYNKLTVIARATNTESGKSRWICLCDCGNIKEKAVTGYDLTHNKVKTCGCLYKESNKHRNLKHGRSGERLHRIWCTMRQRCYNPQSHGYNNYGGRGISVCEEWLNSFQAFYDWAMANGYADNLTIDRIEANGNYCPENCRWADMKKQQNNRRNNRTVQYGEHEYTIAELASKLSVPYATLRGRINKGWDQADWGIKPSYDNKKRRKTA